MRAATSLGIGAAAMCVSVAGAAVFAMNSGASDPATAIVVLIGVIIAASTGLAGLVLVHAPWGRWTLLATLAVSLLLASVTGSSAFWVVLGAGGIVAVGLMGPWLRFWVRQKPSAEAPGPVVVALIAVAPSAALFVGLCSLGGLHAAQVGLILVAIAASWAYGQGLRGGLWALRLAVPLVGVAATAVTTGPGQIAIALGVSVVTILAWLPHARRATAVITPPLPKPFKRNPRSVQNASD